MATVAEVKENKYKYGLKNVYIALIKEETEETTTYDTPVKVNGAVSMSVKSTAERTAIAADDDEEYAVIEENKGYEGDIEFQIMPDALRVSVLGENFDKNGVLIENKDAQTTRAALLFEFSGDEHKTRHLFYNCRFSKPDIESGTKGEKIENKTDKLSIKCMPSKTTGDIKAKAKTGDAPYANWFKSVYIKDSTVAANK